MEKRATRKPSGWVSSNNHTGVYDAKWKKTRKRILKRDNYRCQCLDCTASGRRRPATEVDHKVPVDQGGTEEDSNLQAINSECHKKKTKLDNGQKPSYGCTDEGLPLDPNHPWAKALKEERSARLASHSQRPIAALFLPKEPNMRNAKMFTFRVTYEGKKKTVSAMHAKAAVTKSFRLLPGYCWSPKGPNDDDTLLGSAVAVREDGVVEYFTRMDVG